MTEFDFALLEVFYSLTDSVRKSLEGKGVSEADTLRDSEQHRNHCT